MRKLPRGPGSPLSAVPPPDPPALPLPAPSSSQWREADPGCTQYVLLSDEVAEFSAKRVPRRSELVRMGRQARTRAEWERELRSGGF